MAQWTRVMLTELTRLNSHLVWLGTHAIDIGAMSVFLYCFREREDILRIFEMYSGQRMMTSYFRIGGLALEPPRGWQKRIKSFIDVFPSRVDEYEELLTNNRIWIGRTQGVGRISIEGHAGLGRHRSHAARGGVKWDIRKSQPYSSYEKFDFEVPTRTENDVYARYLVRIEEMRQSARIIRQALEGMPEGRWTADAPHVVLPEREKMKTQMEALIYHFKIVTEGFRVAAGEVYQTIESPRGEVGYYVVSDGTGEALPRARARPQLRQLASHPVHDSGHVDRGRDRLHRQHGFVLGDADR